VKLADGIKRLGLALAGLGYELRFDEIAASAAGVDLGMLWQHGPNGATLDDIEHRILRRAGLKFARKANVIYIIPVDFAMRPSRTSKQN
jgi:hypothetical protein